jgi:signal transduction histidine kinase/CheY-like chemotaxis protein
MMSWIINFLFNAFNNYFLEIPIIIHWVLIGLNIFFYNQYEHIFFLLIIGLLSLNLIILFYEDYNIFNFKIKADFGELIIDNIHQGIILFNKEGEIIMINENFKKIFQNSSIPHQFSNMKIFLESLPEEFQEKFQKNINLSSSLERNIYEDVIINNKDYKLIFEKLKYDEDFIFSIGCEVFSMASRSINTNINNTINVNNNDEWTDIIEKSSWGYIVTDQNQKILKINGKILNLLNKSMGEIKYEFLNKFIDENFIKYLYDDNYENGLVVINNINFYWQKQVIDNYYWFSLMEKNYTNTNEVIKNYQQDIIYQMPMGIVIFNDKEIIYTNDSFKKLLKNKIQNITDLLSQDSIDSILKKWQPLKGDNFLDINLDSLDKNNFNCQKIRIYPMIFHDIRIFSMVDISYYYIQEQQLLHAQRLMTTGEILSGVIHDLNNYLMPILGYTESIFTKINVYDPIYNNMIHLQNNAIRAANLVKYLLNMSRKNTHTSNFVGQLNLKIAELLRSMAKIISKNIEIKFKQGNDVQGLAMGDVLLEQILTNLLINSRDAIVDKFEKKEIEKGLIYITTELITNHYGSNNNGAKIKIYDNGQGIPAINLKKIFDPFFTTKEKNGMGLGLATVKKIIENNNGTIDVMSQDGISTEISIILPSLENQAVEEKSPYITGNTSMMIDSGTILIVEDEGSILRLLKEHLNKTGYEVLEAENGSEALKVVEKYDKNIDFLISDVMLPDISLVAMVKIIEKKYPSIKVILSSGTTEDQVHDIVQDTFKYTFLNKPFPLNTILTTIKTLKK